jgi:DNA-binding FadR family transcriptional regulator
MKQANSALAGRNGVRTTRRTDKVSDQLARAILSEIDEHQLRSGDRLPSEARMLEELGAGRTSLREALRILEVHGIIRVKCGPGGGPVIANPDASDFGRSAALHYQAHDATIADLMDARCVIEPVLARRAAERATPEQGERLREESRRGWDHETGSPNTWGRVSADFHMMIASIAGNKVLSLFNDSLSMIQNERLKPIVPEAERRASLEVHDRIAAAIADGDADRSQSLMEAHMRALQRGLGRFGPEVVDEIIRWR